MNCSCFLIVFALFVIFKIEWIIESVEVKKTEQEKFIECVENNSLTSCLILLFLNERQEKLLLQIQNELSK